VSYFSIIELDTKRLLPVRLAPKALPPCSHRQVYYTPRGGIRCADCCETVGEWSD
jgi:hypothetical protein